MRLFSFMGSLMSAALSALCRKGIVSLRNTVLARPKDRRQLCIAEQGFKRGDRRRALRWHVAHDYLDRENPLGPTTAEPFAAENFHGVLPGTVTPNSGEADGLRHERFISFAVVKVSYS
jgi:hypothetical protein